MVFWGRWLPAAAAAVAAGLLLGCQPVDDVPGGAGVSPADRGVQEAGEAAGMPGSLQALAGELAPAAAQWQRDARIVEVAVTLGDDGEWAEATVTYLAADADRLMLARVSADGTTVQRPTLSTLGLLPVSAEALAAVPSLPDGVLDPAALADAAGEPLDGCGFAGDVSEVVYSTGAPAGWDGERWVEQPSWTAIVGAGEAGAVALDPVTGAAATDPCVSAAAGGV